MNEVPKSWLLPSAFVGYVALSAVYGQAIYGGLRRDLPALSLALILASPFLTAWGLRYASRLGRAGKLSTDERAIRLSVIGAGTLFASIPAEDSQPALLAARSLALGLLVAGAMLGVARLRSQHTVLKNHPSALSLDAFYITTVLWSLVTFVYLMRAAFPGEFPLDPVSLQLGSLFAALGSLLLLFAVILRLQLLRGLQLGVGDRAWAALSVTVAGTIVGGFAGVVLLSTPDTVAGWAVAVVAFVVSSGMASPDPVRVTRLVRGSLAGLLLAAPLGLFLLWVSRTGVSSQELVLMSGLAGILVGVLSRRAARPLSPEGSRWIVSFEKALDAALHPEPDQGIRQSLICLRAAEASSKRRPEVFRLDPPGLISVDIAGYLHEQVAEFPKGIVELAMDEPARTLRRETLDAAQVRNPKVRPLATWFEAHEAKTATVLMDESNPVGLLILPQGRRRSALAMDEANLLDKLARRMAGLLSVTASLKRARQRELDHQHTAEAAITRANDLALRLNQKTRSDHLEAETRVEILRNTANSPAAQVTLLELESSAQASVLLLEAKVGVDPVPWAAHAHLSRFKEPRPLVVVDFRSNTQKTFTREDLEGESSPLRRAQTGSLVLLHPGALSAERQELLAASLELIPPDFLIVAGQLTSGLTAHLGSNFSGTQVRLPTFSDRAEDIQAFIINELSQLGLVKSGQPIGIERAALFELIERPYPGNDDELRGLLTALCGECEGTRIGLDDLRAVLGSAKADPDVIDLQTGSSDPKLRRTRARTPPRAKRH